MDKVIRMFEEAVRKEQFERQMYTFREKQKIMEELDYKVIEKISHIEEKVDTNQKLVSLNLKSYSNLDYL